MVIVAGLVGGTIVGEPVVEGGHGADGVVIGLNERIVVVTIWVVWLIDKVPPGLERVALSLNIVGKSGALSHRVLTFILSDAWVVFF